MSKWNVISEDEKFFHVEGKDGKPLKVAKKGLSKKKQEAIRSWAEGKKAQGGMTDPAPTFADPNQLAQPEFLEQPLLASVDLARQPSTFSGENAPLEPISPAPAAPDVMPEGVGYRSFDYQGPGAKPVQLNEEVRGPWSNATPSEGPRRSPDLFGDGPGTKYSPAQFGEMQAEAARKAAEAAKKQAAERAHNDAVDFSIASAGGTAGSSDLPSYRGASTKGIEGAIDQQKQANEADAGVAARLNAEKAQIQAEGLAQRQALMAKREQERAAGRRRADELRQQVEKGEIDPQRFWKNKSTANKIGSIIALALGTAGANLAKKENTTLKLLNTFIEQDISAQKDNLNQKNNVYRMHLDAMRDEEAAHAQTMADYYTMIQMRVEQVATKYGGEAAASLAQKLNAGLELKKQESLYAAADKRADQSFALDLRRAERAAEQKKLATASAVMQHLAHGNSVPSDYYFQLDDKTRRQVVTDDQGRLRLATSEDAAKKYNDTRVNHDALNSGFAQLRQLRKDNGGEILPTEAKEQMVAVRESIILKLKELEKLGVLTGNDYQILSAKVPDPTRTLFSAMTDSKFNSLMDTLESDIRDRLRVNSNAYLLGRPVQPTDQLTKRNAPKK